MLHAGELEIPTEPDMARDKWSKFTAKMKAPMERALDHLHIPKVYYI